MPILYFLVVMSYLGGSFQVVVPEFQSEQSCNAARDFMVKNANGNKAFMVSDCMKK